MRAADVAFRCLLGPGWFGPRQQRLREAVAGRVVLVTGASSGIGEATARLLAAAGAELILVARRETLLADLAERIKRAGGTAHVHPTDLADIAAVEDLVDAVIADHRTVDVVVSNAGRSIHRSLAASTDRFHDVTHSNDVNFLGPVRLLIGLLPSMRASGGGHIINVSSISVDVPAAHWSAYTATKSAFEGWLRCIAPEVRVDGVATSSIHFPNVHTPMSAPTYGQLPGLSADDAAAVIARAIVTRRRLISPWYARLAGPVLDAAQGPFDAATAMVLRIRSATRTR